MNGANKRRDSSDHQTTACLVEEEAVGLVMVLHSHWNGQGALVGVVEVLMHRTDRNSASGAGTDMPFWNVMHTADTL